MYDVILFGGTDEGHKIADFLVRENINHIVCVATDYGARLLSGANVRTGRMTEDEMRAFFRKENARIVVDATHPYADAVTANIKAACECKYIRVLRGDDTDLGKRFASVADAVSYLKNKSGNIFITTGAKEIGSFSPLRERSRARVLPSEESLAMCCAAGFEMSRVICMQGPFSKELNAALLREYDIKFLVTKSAGKNGGFKEKADAAAETGAELIVIDRPQREDGVTLEEAENLILEWL